jgi:hypothetical protein
VGLPLGVGNGVWGRGDSVWWYSGGLLGGIVVSVGLDGRDIYID